MAVLPLGAGLSDTFGRKPMWKDPQIQYAAPFVDRSLLVFVERPSNPIRGAIRAFVDRSLLVFHPSNGLSLLGIRCWARWVRHSLFGFEP